MKVTSIKLECTVMDRRQYPRSRRPEVAVSGRSNVGKSSLLNMMLGRRNLARVSREPGKTRTFNFFLVNERFYLVDLPGYGFAKVSKKERDAWRRKLGGYIGGREHLRGVIQLLDVRREPSEEDVDMMQRAVDAGRSMLIVFTKSDKIGRGRRRQVLERLSESFDGIGLGLYGSEDEFGGPFEVPVVFSSATNGEGKEAIWQWVKRAI